MDAYWKEARNSRLELTVLAVAKYSYILSSRMALAIMVPGPTRVARRVEIGSGLRGMAAVNPSHSPTVLSALTGRTAVSLVNRHTAVHDRDCNLQLHKFIQYAFLTDPEAIVR